MESHASQKTFFSCRKKATKEALFVALEKTFLRGVLAMDSRNWLMNINVLAQN
jgi:hypothetical protein